MKIEGPLFSQKASKQLGHLLTYKNYGKRNILTKYSKPGDVKPFTKSASQSQMRTIYGEAVEAWRNLPENEKNQYRIIAKSKKYSGYNIFMKEYFTTHPIVSDLSYYGQRIHGIFVYGKI